MTLEEAYQKAEEVFKDIKEEDSRFDGHAFVQIKNGSELWLERAYITFLDDYLVVFSQTTRPIIFPMSTVSNFSNGEREGMDF